MISVIIPASNEAVLIGRCLSSVLASVGPDVVEVIVVANGCRDDTAAQARAFEGQFLARGWTLTVIERAQGGKPGALNAGDSVANGDNRLYLDADIEVAPELLGQLDEALTQVAPIYVSGKMRIAHAQTMASRAYGRIYARVPFMTDGVPGAGLFAVNAAGRARWAQFPEIISDDTFVRLSFRPQERQSVVATYDWPLVEGFSKLVKVRRRQDAGVAEIAALYPEFLENDDKHALGFGGVLRLFVSDPVGFVVYVSVAVIVRLTRRRGDDKWERGR